MTLSTFNVQCKLQARNVLKTIAGSTWSFEVDIKKHCTHICITNWQQTHRGQNTSLQDDYMMLFLRRPSAPRNKRPTCGILYIRMSYNTYMTDTLPFKHNLHEINYMTPWSMDVNERISHYPSRSPSLCWLHICGAEAQPSRPF